MFVGFIHMPSTGSRLGLSQLRQPKCKQKLGYDKIFASKV